MSTTTCDLHELRRECRSLIPAVLVLALGLTLNTWADATWTGAARNGQWSTSGNWAGGIMPGISNGVTHLGDQTYGSLITMSPGVTATVDADIFGPEFGMDLTIDGASLTQLAPGFVFAPVGEDEAGRSVVTVQNGGNLQVVNLLIGDNWWFQQPFVTLNVYDTSTVKATDWAWLGGHMNLYGGTVDIDGGFNMAANAAMYGTDKTLLDIYDGSLTIRGGDYSGDVPTWMANGWLKAFGGVGFIQVDTASVPGGTVLTAVIPEPATLALTGFGLLGLVLVRRRG